jgi:membrane protease YdiL (CAAX protease family)
MPNEFQKVGGYTSEKAGSIKNALHTRLSFMLIVIATSVMYFMGFRHLNDLDAYGQEWGKFALLQASLCLIGYVGGQIATQQPLIPKIFRPIDFDSAIHTLVILFAAMFTQLITQYTFSVENTEKAVYYIFAAVCEESFFRGFIITAILRISDKFQFKIIAVMVSASAFAAMHTNYYNNPDMLAGVAVGGLILGSLFVLWNDITANILGHFALNFIATWNWLVTLAALPTFLIVNIIVLIALGILLLRFYKNRIIKYFKRWRNKRNDIRYIR